MPMFYVEGKGKESGRKRKPFHIIAKNVTSARTRIRKNGIAPDKIELVRINQWATHVAGTTHKNRDGSDRQQFVRSCNVHERLILEREIENPHDAHAVRIVRDNGQQVGYLPAEVAHDVVEGFFKAEGSCRAAAVNLRQEPWDAPDSPLTLQIIVLVSLSDVSDDDIAAYADNIEDNGVGRCLPLVPVSSVRFQPAKQELKQRKSPAVNRSPAREQQGCLGVVMLCICCAVLFALLTLE